MQTGHHGLWWTLALSGALHLLAIAYVARPGTRPLHEPARVWPITKALSLPKPVVPVEIAMSAATTRPPVPAARAASEASQPPQATPATPSAAKPAQRATPVKFARASEPVLRPSAPAAPASAPSADDGALRRTLQRVAATRELSVEQKRKAMLALLRTWEGRTDADAADRLVEELLQAQGGQP